MTSFKSKTKNRNPVKYLFITYPHSTVSKTEFIQSIEDRFELDYYKVCEESHASGEPHLHALVRFVNKYSKNKVLQHLQSVYPDASKRMDVAIVRSIDHADAYLDKEDQDTISRGILRQPYKVKWCKLYTDFCKEIGLGDIKSFGEYLEKS